MNEATASPAESRVWWRSEGLLAVFVVTVVSLPDFSLMVPEPLLTVADISLHPMDVVALAAAILGVWRMIRTRKLGVESGAVAVLWLLLAVEVLRGAMIFGFQPSVNFGRVLFYGLAALTYAAWLPRRWSRRDLLGGVPALLVILGLCLGRFLASGLLLRHDGDNADVLMVDLRPVSASGAFFLLAAAFIVVSGRTRSGTRSYIAAGALALVVVLVQQRTVWFCIAAAVPAWIIASWLDVREGVLVMPKRFLQGVTAIGVVVVVGVLVTPSLRNSATDTSNLTWRFHQWGDGITAMPDAVAWIIGRPSASSRDQWDFSAYLNRVKITHGSGLTTHSTYVDLLLLVGLVGLAAVLVLIFRSATRRYDRLWISSPGAVALIVAVVVYGVTYFLPVIAFALVGMALAERIRQRPWSNGPLESGAAAASELTHG